MNSLQHGEPREVAKILLSAEGRTLHVAINESLQSRTLRYSMRHHLITSYFGPGSRYYYCVIQGASYINFSLNDVVLHFGQHSNLKKKNSNLSVITSEREFLILTGLFFRDLFRPG